MFRLRRPLILYGAELAYVRRPFIEELFVVVLELPHVFVLIVLEGFDDRILSEKPGGLLVCLEFFLHKVLAPLLSKHEVFGIVVGGDGVRGFARFPLVFEIQSNLFDNHAIADFGIFRRILCRVLGSVEEISDVGGELSDILIAPFVDSLEVLFYVVVDLFEFLAHDHLKGDLLGFQGPDWADVVLYGLRFSRFVCLDTGIDVSSVL